ncbi:BolA family protein [Halopseudomonas pelagia]|uniref:BolA family protein n=1 Tax=Halopseudomonas pelagia TaxID=553151 RepID=UPI0003A91F56|nr:BolA family protein [Halopseudomonas pelagia]
MTSTTAPTQNALQQALQSLAPEYLELVNESHMHSVPPGSESHFKAVVVSQQFVGLNAVKRHQAVYRSLGDLMASIHALALHTYTPDEWTAREQAPASPNCLGGGKADA